MKDEIIQIDGKFYKQCEVVMFPTERNIPCKNSIIKSNITNKLNIFDPYGIGFLNKDKNQVMQHLYILSSEEIKEGDWYMYCHFGEWIISNSRETLKKGTNTLENLNKDDYFKKIIATTDDLIVTKQIGTISTGKAFNSKPLPRTSDDFIKAFVEKQGKIDKVLVEYENINTTKQEDYKYNDKTGGNLNYVWKLKVAPDNTITIKPIQEEKTSWSREEVIKLCMDAMLYSYMDLPENLTPIQGMNKWIEENLK